MERSALNDGLIISTEIFQQCPMDISNLRYMDELIDVIDYFGLSEENICITGSAPLALYNVRENRDIDIIATEEEREKITQQIDDARINKSGHADLSENTELSRSHRYDTIGLTDDMISSDDSYYFMLGRYKVLKPEIALSIKASERRPKDIEDLKRVDECGILKTYDWDWDLVTVLPPWERPSLATERTSSRLLKRGLTLLKDEGVISTLRKTASFVLNSAENRWDYLDGVGARADNAIDKLPDVGESLDNAHCKYTLPELIAQQYNDAGEFERYDLIVSMLSLKGRDEFTGSITETDYKRGIRVSRNEKLVSGITELTREIHEPQWKVNDGALPTVSIERVREDPLEPRAHEWAQTRFDDREIDLINEKKTALLESSGTAFYAILWPKLGKNFPEAQRLVESEFNVFNSREYVIEDGFEAFVLDLYSGDKRNEDWFRNKKLHELSKYKPQVRMLSLEIPNPSFRMSKGQKLEESVHRKKLSLREQFQDMIDNYVYGTEVHITDNFTHNMHINNMISNIRRGEYTHLGKDISNYHQSIE